MTKIPTSIITQREIVSKLGDLRDLLGEEVMKSLPVPSSLVEMAKLTGDTLEREKMRLEMLEDDYKRLGDAFVWADYANVREQIIFEYGQESAKT